LAYNFPVAKLTQYKKIMAFYRCIRKRPLRFLAACAHKEGKMLPSSYLVQCSNSSSTNIRLPVERWCSCSVHVVTPIRKQSTYTTAKDDDNSVWLKMCLSMKDVKIKESADKLDPILSYHKYKRTNCTLLDVKKKAYALFDTLENLEYYDMEQQTWYRIDEMSNSETLLASYKGRVLHLRIPEYFDSFVIGDVNGDADDEVFGFNPSDDDFSIHKRFNLAEDDTIDPTMDPTIDRYSKEINTTLRNKNVTSSKSRTRPEYLMEQMIRSLQQKLNEQGYKRSKIKTMILYNIRNNDEIFTKEWVQRECHTSAQLRSIILGSTNAFNHIVQCLHYDFLWKDPN
jgi:hypothetical protein